MTKLTSQSKKICKTLKLFFLNIYYQFLLYFVLFLRGKRRFTQLGHIGKKDKKIQPVPQVRSKFKWGPRTCMTE